MIHHISGEDNDKADRLSSRPDYDNSDMKEYIIDPWIWSVFQL